ncbi:hypothetical protein RFI_15586 [Reticulomyxa filosa]|uniref:Uncharacterized protein n=1 Tax=Reticulomyxa filosa TaxID=46433 RepID=X6N6Q2_RETFI|nr:hypothetical protein RFI_15586 [Reticulomyxa filosa]|eukprot:ETO21618.1 hypothetical protein RFI_15586 [Reticulomyxa filosa]
MSLKDYFMSKPDLAPLWPAVSAEEETLISLASEKLWTDVSEAFDALQVPKASQSLLKGRLIILAKQRTETSKATSNEDVVATATETQTQTQKQQQQQQPPVAAVVATKEATPEQSSSPRPPPSQRQAQTKEKSKTKETSKATSDVNVNVNVKQVKEEKEKEKEKEEEEEEEEEEEKTKEIVTRSKKLISEAIEETPILEFRQEEFQNAVLSSQNSTDFVTHYERSPMLNVSPFPLHCVANSPSDLVSKIKVARRTPVSAKWPFLHHCYYTWNSSLLTRRLGNDKCQVFWSHQRCCLFVLSFILSQKKKKKKIKKIVFFFFGQSANDWTKHVHWTEMPFGDFVEKVANSYSSMKAKNVPFHDSYKLKNLTAKDEQDIIYYSLQIPLGACHHLGVYFFFYYYLCLSLK